MSEESLRAAREMVQSLVGNAPTQGPAKERPTMPSDEELAIAAHDHAVGHPPNLQAWKRGAFVSGAEWMRKRLLG